MGDNLAKKNTTKSRTRSSYAREIIALAFLALASILILSIASYYPSDNTLLSVNSDSDKTHNYIGPVGANIAAILIQIFGYSSYIFPAALFIGGGCLLSRIHIHSLLTKSIGIVGLTVGSSILLGYAIPRLTINDINHPFPGGGVLSKVLIDFAQPQLGEIGVLIVAAVLVGISLLLSIHFSIASFLGSLWGGVHKTAKNMKNRHISPSASKRKEKKAKVPKVVIKVKFGRSKKHKSDSELLKIQDYSQGKMIEEDLGELPSHTPEQVKVMDIEEEFKPEIKLPRKRRIVRPENLIGLQAPIDLLDEPPAGKTPLNLKKLAEQARTTVNLYREFGIEGEVLQTNPGPVVNTFEFKPAPGVKYNKVVNLANELCMALKAISIRISRIAGKSTIGIEVPNLDRETIFFREMIESPEYHNSASPLTIGLGKTITGEPYVTRLDEMPHLLIGGATGTGKSVALNTMICSMLFKSPPDTTKLILVDPKQVELSLYEGIPHLLTPVISHPKKAATALRWACEEMEIRYRKLASQGVRNISQYNQVVNELNSAPIEEEEEAEQLEPMPYIVVVIDELADLMMVASADVEESICRLAQKARAVGIHLIIATQRPSVDILTGVIKANFPCRISFGVFSKVDSRVILDSYGAEDLLGKGDMLFMPPGSSRLSRLHGSLINEKEIKRLVNHLKRIDVPEYDDDIITMQEESDSPVSQSLAPDKDPLFDEAVNLVLATNVASISNLQRKMRLGYARAARIIDMMEAEGIIGPADGAKPRQILKKEMM